MQVGAAPVNGVALTPFFCVRVYMRILFFARSKKRTRTPAHLVHALRDLGHSVKLIRYGAWESILGQHATDALCELRAQTFHTDLVLVWKHCISVPLLERLARRHKTALWCVDWFDPLPPNICERGRLVDLFLLSNSGQLEDYRRAGVRHPAFWPQACDPRDHYPEGGTLDASRPDVAFIGSIGSGQRGELLRAVDAQCRLKIRGPGWDRQAGSFRDACSADVLPAQYRKTCAQARIVLGCDAMRGVDHCFSNRTWITLGCRAFLLTNYSPGLEDFFENHKHLAWYKTREECLELIRHYLPREDDRLRIAEAGYQLVRSRHTYVHRARELIGMVGQLG